MNRVSLFFLLALATTLTACGDFYVEERLYGTWVEPLDGGIIEFREDGTLNWNGEEGTFDFVRSTNWAVCYGMAGCADGQVSISLPGQSFRKSLYRSNFDHNPNHLRMSGRNTAGVTKDVNFYGRSVGSFSLYRQGTFSGSLMPDHFTRMSAGIPDENYLSVSLGEVGSSNGEVVANLGYALRRFEENTQSWVEVGDEYDILWPTPSGVLYRNDPPIGDAHQVSFDAGRTWSNVPESGEDSIREYVMGTTAVSVEGTYEDDLEAYGVMTIWTMDLTAQSPGWTRQSELPAGTATGLAYNFKDIDALIIEKYDEGNVNYQISRDFGVTWVPFTNLCYGADPKRHTNGFYCVSESKTLSWFDYESLSWTDYDVGFELTSGSLAQVGTPTDAAYLINGEQLIEWRPQSTENITSLSSNITGSTGGVHVLDDQVLVNKVGLWRTLR